MVAPRILVVDDEADLRELLEMTLLRMGLDVDSAATLGEARAFLARTDYALVLTDMRLPDGLGLELVRAVCSAGKNTPIAVVTAFGSADNAVVALKAGAFDYISKPVALDQLRLMVRSALRLNEEAAAGQAPSAEPVASRFINCATSSSERPRRVILRKACSRPRLTSTFRRGWPRLSSVSR